MTTPTLLPRVPRQVLPILGTALLLLLLLFFLSEWVNCVCMRNHRSRVIASTTLSPSSSSSSVVSTDLDDDQKQGLRRIMDEQDKFREKIIHLPHTKEYVFGRYGEEGLRPDLTEQTKVNTPYEKLLQGIHPNRKSEWARWIKHKSEKPLDLKAEYQKFREYDPPPRSQMTLDQYVATQQNAATAILNDRYGKTNAALTQHSDKVIALPNTADDPLFTQSRRRQRGGTIMGDNVVRKLHQITAKDQYIVRKAQQANMADSKTVDDIQKWWEDPNRHDRPADMVDLHRQYVADDTKRRQRKGTNKLVSTDRVLPTSNSKGSLLGGNFSLSDLVESNWHYATGGGTKHPSSGLLAGLHNSSGLLTGVHNSSGSLNRLEGVRSRDISKNSPSRIASKTLLGRR